MAGETVWAAFALHGTWRVRDEFDVSFHGESKTGSLRDIPYLLSKSDHPSNGISFLKKKKKKK